MPLLALRRPQANRSKLADHDPGQIPDTGDEAMPTTSAISRARQPKPSELRDRLNWPGFAETVVCPAFRGVWFLESSAV